MKFPRSFNKGLTYYIAGPMSGYDDFNYPAFEKMMLELQRDEVSVCSPHTIPWPEPRLEGDALWKHMMRHALHMLLECEGIILLPGWVDSKGAMLEHQIAAQLKLPSYFADGKYIVEMRDTSRAKNESVIA